MATLSDVANITVSKNRDETINGNIMFNGWVNSNHRNANSVFYGYDGSDYSLVGWKREGSGIEIFGSESANCARWLRLRCSDDSTYWNDLDVRNNGVFFNGQPIVRLVESWKSGETWFRRYSDGWIEQGGYVGCGVVKNSYYDLTFPTPFTQIPTVNISYALRSYTEDNCWNLLAKVGQAYTSTIRVWARSDNGSNYSVPFNWYACGY